MYENKQRSVLAIILARGGSKELPRKNIRKLAGKPLIAYSIGQALESRYIGRVVVSTEDREIARVAARYQAEVIRRPDELALDDTSSVDALRHTLDYLKEAEGYSPDLVVLLQPTSPLRKVEDIDGAIDRLLEVGCDSVVSVCEVEHPAHWMYTLEGERLKPIVGGGRKVGRRQDAPKVYRLNGAVYVTHRDVVMRQGKVMGDDTRAYIMPQERSVDIDTELDFKLAELLMRERDGR